MVKLIKIKKETNYMDFSKRIVFAQMGNNMHFTGGGQPPDNLPSDGFTSPPPPPPPPPPPAVPPMPPAPPNPPSPPPPPSSFEPPEESQPPARYPSIYSEKPPQTGKKAAIIAAIIFGVVALFCLVAFGVLATRIWDPPWNPFSPKPEEVMGKMLMNMGKVKSAHVKGTSASQDKAFGSSSLSSFNGDIDFSNPENPQTKMSFEAKTSFEETTGNEISLKGEFRLINKKIYLRMEEINLGAVFNLILGTFMSGGNNLSSAKPGADYSPFLNKWITIDPQTLSSTAAGGSSASDIDKTVAALKAMAEPFLKRNVFTVKSRLGDENMAGEPAYHFVVGLDKGATKEAVMELVSSVSSLAGNTLTAEMQNQIKSQIDKDLEKSLDGVEIGLWIGKNDYMLYKIETNVSGDNSSQFSAELSGFNDITMIEAPKDSTDIIEVIAPVIKAANEDPKKKDIATVMADFATSASQQKDGNFSKVVCTAADFKGYCAKIKSLTGYNPAVYRTAKAYCAVAGITNADKTKSFYCVDSTGANSWVADGVSPLTVGNCNGKTFVCPKPKGLVEGAGSPAADTSGGEIPIP